MRAASRSHPAWQAGGLDGIAAEQHIAAPGMDGLTSDLCSQPGVAESEDPRPGPQRALSRQQRVGTQLATLELDKRGVPVRPCGEPDRLAGEKKLTAGQRSPGRTGDQRSEPPELIMNPGQPLGENRQVRQAQPGHPTVRPPAQAENGIVTPGTPTGRGVAGPAGPCSAGENPRVRTWRALHRASWSHFLACRSADTDRAMRRRVDFRRYGDSSSSSASSAAATCPSRPVFCAKL